MRYTLPLVIVLTIFSQPARAQISADHWRGGAVRVGPSVTHCETAISGAIQFDSNTHVLKYCDGTAWRTVGATVSGTDSTPDPFSFTDLTNQPLSTMVFSNILTITGIDPDQTASVTGAGTPQIRVNNGAWVTAASISSGDELQIRLISASTATTARNAVISVGTANDTWSVTTRAGQTYVFITSTKYAGDFGGVSGADNICMIRANAAGLSGVWKAIISDSTIDAKDRLNITYPVVNLTGNTIAASDFFSSTLTARALSEYNTSVGDSGQHHLWSGTDIGGVKSSNNCSNWTLITGNGRLDRLLDQDIFASIIAGYPTTCSTTYRLGCMQQ